MMTAHIAFSRLNPKARAKVIELLAIRISPAAVSAKSKDFVSASHWADDLRATYAVNYANGILRQKLGMQNLARATSGLGYYSKLALAGAVKFSGLQKKREMKFKIDFAVDPAARGSVRDIPAYSLSK